jgi:hypothetical protein
MPVRVVGLGIQGKHNMKMKAYMGTQKGSLSTTKTFSDPFVYSQEWSRKEKTHVVGELTHRLRSYEQGMEHLSLMKECNLLASETCIMCSMLL